MVSLSASLHLSLSEVSESLNRSWQAGLIDTQKKKVNRQNLLEFLFYGMKYVFPQQAGTMLRGIPTAHTHPALKEKFVSNLNFVWPDQNGKELGLMVEPFYNKQVLAVREDPIFYHLLALSDVLRVGKVREVEYAKGELNRLLKDE